MKGHRLHFVLTGGWFSSDNIGDNAILLGLVDALRRRFADPEISVITAAPDRVTRLYGLPAYAPKRTPVRLLREVASADALVFTGGTPFYSQATHMSYYAALARWASLRRVPIAIFGISLRSITGRYPRYLLDRIASASRLLGAREDRTLMAFAEIVGADDPRLALVPDASTQLQPADPDRARQLIERAGADTTTPLVAVCLRDFTAGRSFAAHHYTRQLSPDELTNYIETSGALIEHAVRAHGAGVVLCPMNTNPPDDDRRIMQEILDGIDDRSVASRVTLIREQHGPRDMKAMLGLMQACVGVRFHSLMLATSMEVPSLSLAYAQKNHAVMNQMGLERYSLDIAALERDEAIELFDDLMGNHSSVAATLRSKNAEMLALYDRGLDHLSRAMAPR